MNSTQTSNEPSEESNKKGGAAVIVLQWLSYSLWEWTLIALSVLLSATLAYFLVHTGSADYEFVLYVIAAIVCLLPAAIVADRMYAKREPDHKQGFAAVVQVINAVIVFLATLGGFITFVVSMLSLAINAGASSGTIVVIISSLVVSVLGALLFLRIMHFIKLRPVARLFIPVIALIATTGLGFAIAGPFRSAILTKTDRLIERNLYTLNSSIQEYANSKQQLPASLEDLELGEGDARLLVTRNLVSYERKVGADSSFSYTLCVTYRKELKSTYPKLGYPTEKQNQTYIDTSFHPAGKQCYDLVAGISTIPSNSATDLPAVRTE